MSFVYFIETADQRFVKIGFSTHVFRRHSELGTLRPSNFDLRLLGAMPGTRQTESWLHGKFAEDRDNGEWFRNTPRLQAFIFAIGVIAPSGRELRDMQSVEGEPLLRIPIRTISLASAAVTLGRRGGIKRVPKGFSLMDPKRRSEIAKAAAAKRWAKKDGEK